MSINVADLDRLTDEEITTLYEGVRALRRTKAGYALVQDSIEKTRAGHGPKPQRFEVPINFNEENE